METAKGFATIFSYSPTTGFYVQYQMFFNKEINRYLHTELFCPTTKTAGIVFHDNFHRGSCRFDKRCRVEKDDDIVGSNCVMPPPPLARMPSGVPIVKNDWPDILMGGNDKKRCLRKLIVSITDDKACNLVPLVADEGAAINRFAVFKHPCT